MKSGSGSETTGEPEDSDADMDNTQDEDSCVSHVAKSTAGDLQLGMGISMPHPNKCDR